MSHTFHDRVELLRGAVKDWVRLSRYSRYAGIRRDYNIGNWVDVEEIISAEEANAEGGFSVSADDLRDARRVKEILESHGEDVAVWLVQQTAPSPIPDCDSLILFLRNVQLRPAYAERVIAVLTMAAARAKAECPVPRRMTVDDANRVALKKADEMGPAFFGMAPTAQAKLIGCHLKTWEKCKLYKESVKRGKGKPKGETRNRRAATLSARDLDRQGSGITGTSQPRSTDTVLDEMAAAEEAAEAARKKKELAALLEQPDPDYMPSPLEPDQPGKKRRGRRNTI